MHKIYKKKDRKFPSMEKGGGHEVLLSVEELLVIDSCSENSNSIKN